MDGFDTRPLPPTFFASHHGRGRALLGGVAQSHTSVCSFAPPCAKRDLGSCCFAKRRKHRNPGDLVSRRFAKGGLGSSRRRSACRGGIIGPIYPFLRHAIHQYTILDCARPICLICPLRPIRRYFSRRLAFASAQKVDSSTGDLVQGSSRHSARRDGGSGASVHSLPPPIWSHFFVKDFTKCDMVLY